MTWVLLRHHTIHITDSGIILFRPTSMSGLLCLEIIPPQSSNNGLIYPDLSLPSKRRFMTTGSALVDTAATSKTQVFDSSAVSCTCIAADSQKDF
ncbi:uncharacterized protein LOC141596731 isoform X3 [Silene latifolia]|uniref:uncharacterized protein LOC141596731 isoform X3 n=1 Tax=Silene latifolia TaxID=37657 RepID=UPI003D78AD3F